MFEKTDMMRAMLRAALFAATVPALVMTPAFAAEDEDKAKLDKVEVTGSHIKRVDVEGPSPVLVIDRAAIENSGASTVAEVLRRMPANNGPSFDEKFTNSFAPGSAGLSLRGLGQNATLVLVNGRRVANYGFAQNINSAFVDLNSIPLAAVDRIEVLKDGASAIYGSDAIAGVVNIILRKDYEGTEVTLRAGTTEREDVGTQRLQLVSGKSTSRGNVTAIFDFHNREDAMLVDRSFSASADHTLQEPDNGYNFTSSAFPHANVIDPNVGFIDINGRFDYNPFITMIPATQSLGFNVLFNHEIGSETNFYADLQLASINTRQQAAPTPLFGDQEGTLVPAANPFNTYGVDVFTRWRMLQAGPRQNELDTIAGRALLGLNGMVGNWDWDTALVYARSETENEGTNYINRQALIDGIANETINPFGAPVDGPFANDPAVINSLKASTLREATSDLMQFDLKGSTTLAELPAGPLGMAIGVEYREETLEDIPDPLVESGDIVGSGGTASDGERDLTSAFLEFEVPLHDTLEMQLAVRGEDYSDFGTTTNPKIAFRYQPTDWMMLRTSYGTGFRAPSLPELFLGKSESHPFLVDVARCDVTGADEDCGGSQYLTEFAGNPDLEPEESENIYFGVVFEPMDNLTVGLDYWKFDHTDIIDANTQNILNNEALLPGAVERLPTEADGTPGRIVLIHDSFRNIAEQQTDGIDVDITYDHSESEYGDFRFQLLGTFLRSFERSPVTDAPMGELAGEYQYPKRRFRAAADWDNDVMGTTVGIDFISSYNDFFTDHNDEETRVKAFSTIDAQYRYKGLKNTKLVFGIDNLLDKNPPFANSETEGYDFVTHNPLGRSYYASVNYSF